MPAPLDPEFLRRLRAERPLVEHVLRHEVMPHLPPQDAADAWRVLREKYDELPHLLARSPRATLNHLIRYRGMKRVR